MKRSAKISIVLIAAVMVAMIWTNMNLKPNIITPQDLCVQKCKDQLDAGTDLSNGPCLSNKLDSGWVCDVAHSPRTDVDNKLENQCSEYMKTAFHFVEVDPNCNFIRAV